MKRNKLKTYAPKARRDFIRAVTEQAAKVGIGRAHIEPVEVQGDVAIIGGRAFPSKVGQQRQKLESRIGLHGFNQVMEGVAYTWFNRFAAIRYMEVHEYLDHGYRVLSHPEGRDMPQILERADHVDLPGLDRERVIDLKLDGTKDAELYRMLLIAQCNALHAAMPFLFEKIDDETELLLPDNLLHSDSLIRQMVAEIDEEDWREIEIIGWLYQFYISEKKDQVIGKVVKSEDIPAATQLFTPNWIVKYMVQNSLGAQWLATYPDSPLKAALEYYIEPAEQTEEVQRQLAENTPKELNPEELTLIDPACGSGHILVEGYDLFKEIYLERGYRLRDIPRLILEKNLFGLDIDDRAAQMAGFALLMKARADDRRNLSNPVHLNVMSIQSSEGLDAAEIAKHVLPSGRYDLLPGDDLLPETLAQPTLVAKVPSEVKPGTLLSLINLFMDAKTFGSLITVPGHIAKALPALEALVESDDDDDFFRRQAKQSFAPLVAQAKILTRKYDCVVANPPYMGSKGMNPHLKTFAKDHYPDSKSDLFAIFIERNLEFVANLGAVAMITMQSWMFLSSYENLRTRVINRETISNMAHLGARAFDSIGGSVVSTTTFVVNNIRLPTYNGGYLRLVDGGSEAEKQLAFRQAIENPDCGWFHRASAADFKKIPGNPIAYWVSEDLRGIFQSCQQLQNFGVSCIGLQTGDNARFTREWHEVAFEKIGFGLSDRSETLRDNLKWYPYNKGGGFRKWSGNKSIVVNWENDGAEIIEYQIYLNSVKSASSKMGIANNSKYYFKKSISWSKVSSGNISFRYYSRGFIFDVAGTSFFPSEERYFLGILNSKVIPSIVSILSPTMNFESGAIRQIPVVQFEKNIISNIANSAILLASADWNSYETSWDFSSFVLLHPDHHQSSLSQTYHNLRAHWQCMTEEMQGLEEENNRIFIDAYGLVDELTPEVPLKEITLTCNLHYRYRGDLTDTEREERLRDDTMRELICYAIGCMMGRYSLDEVGLIYAHSGNKGFDASKYTTFAADDDGIIPITDIDWFDDDAARRFSEFLSVAWSPEALRENLQFVADSLSPKRGETPLDTIRRYLSNDFYKYHLKTYKKRPIYWLFSSGKQKAFECLTYLHRYNESTLSRMRIEYVIPLQSKFAARIEQLDGDITAATSTSNRHKLEKEKDSLLKKQTELVDFDDKLRHYADQRIALDLDDGVKVNYGKFGDLLAEVNAVTGKKDG